MNGIEEYREVYRKRIQNKVDENKDILFLQSFVNSLSNKQISTKYNYVSQVVLFIRDRNKDVSKINYDDYIDYMAKKEGNTSSYQINVYAALNALSEYLYNTHKAEEHYMDKVKMPKFRETIDTTQKRSKGYLTQEEIKEYISNVKNCIGKTSRECALRENWNERDVCIISLFLTTGMRCSALYKLDVDSINFDENKLSTIDKEGAIQEYPLSEEVMLYIKRWLKKREDLLNSYNHTNALFISKNRKRLSNDGISNIVHKYAVTIEGKNITPHKLRATYGTMIYESTGDLYMVQQAMDHKNPKTSELYIRGKNDECRKQAMNIMNDFIF